MATIEKEKALDVVRQMVADGQVSQEVAEKYFPELKESEDEKIRKYLIDVVNDYCKGNEHDGCIAWLEKQKKPVISDDAIREGIVNFGITQYQIDNWLKKYVDVEKQCEQKPVEDRYMEGYLNGTNDALKTLKPAEWSEEDRETIDYLIDYLESELDSSYTKEDKEEFTKEIELLKSLRPQSAWKPSDEQMNALNYVVNLMASSERPTENDSYYNILKSLRQQLKKLMEDKLKDK